MSSFIVIPLIAALIGWVTNYIAVKMLFHPRNPWKLLWIFPIQGIFPKRQQAFAEKLGDLVASELLSTTEVTSKLQGYASSPEMVKVVRNKIEQALVQRLPEAVPMAALFLTPELISKVSGAFAKDLPEMIQGLTSEMTRKLESDLDIRELVRDKVANFSSDKLEQILFSIMKSEFRFVELVGGVLGFAIGVVQVALLKVDLEHYISTLFQ